VADFKIGDRVHGRLFKNADGVRACGTVEHIDSVGDPRIRVEEVFTSDPDLKGIPVCYLEGGSVRVLGGASGRNDPGPLPARAKALREAESLITGDRNATYGEPTENFQDIARVWNVYLAPKLREGARISAADTAWMMVALKMVRSKARPTRDNWVDAAGYAACGLECDIAEGVIDS
jgi:hypothetical protein